MYRKSILREINDIVMIVTSFCDTHIHLPPIFLVKLWKNANLSYVILIHSSMLLKIR